MMQDPIATVGTCQIEKKKRKKNGSLVRSSDLSITKRSNRAVVGISRADSYGFWFVIQGILRLGAMPYAHKQFLHDVG